MKSKLQQTLEKRSKVITAELMPPRGGSPIRSIKIAQLLKDKVHAVNLSFRSCAILRDLMGSPPLGGINSAVITLDFFSKVC